VKKSYFPFVLMLCMSVETVAQVFVDEPDVKHITITPRGINSGHNTALGTTNTALGVYAMPDLTTGTNNSALGARSLQRTTTGTENTAIGEQTLTYNVGNRRSTAVGRAAMRNADSRTTGRDTYNTAFGQGALAFGPSGSQLLNTGRYNTAIGISVMGNNTAGSFNTAIGDFNDNTEGAYNTAIGGLYYNTTGNFNTSVEGLFFNTTGSSNLAIGTETLRDNIGNHRSTAVGDRAMMLAINTTEGYNTYNTAVGAQSGASSGRYNTAFGARSGILKGSENTSSGYNALTNFANSTPNRNTAAGRGAMGANIDGSDNTIIGSLALTYPNRNSRTTAIGKNATGFLGDKSVVTDMYNTAVGVSALAGGASAADTGRYNTAIGFEAMKGITSGGYNTAVGAYFATSIPTWITTGSNNTMVGYNAQIPSATTDNQIRMGNASVTCAQVQVAWSVTSDRRWKENIQPLNIGMNFLKELRPVSYHRKINPQPDLEMGLIAQEVEEVLDKFDLKNAGILHKDDRGYLSLRYNDLIPVLVKALQEQQTNIENLKEVSTQITQEREALLAERQQLMEELKALTSKAQSLK
jgi:trimeric autotransporter adhesin